MTLSCAFCGEPFEREPLVVRPHLVLRHGHTASIAAAHWECSMANVIGSYGHHWSHEYWCDQMGDPCGGLSYRESSQRVAKLVNDFGVHAVVMGELPADAFPALPGVPA